MSGIEPNPVSKRACVSHWRRVWYLEPKWLRCLLYLSVRVGQDYKFTAPKKKRSLIQVIGKKLNQKITIIGKINNSYKKNIIKLNNKPLNLSKYKGYSHKF